MILNTTLNKYNEAIFILFSILFVFWSCKGGHSQFTNQNQSQRIILKYNNIELYKYTDRDSVINFVGMDIHGKFNDTVSLRYYEPEILLKDFNQDGINDVLVIFNFSDNHILYKYWMYLSDKGSLTKPQVNHHGKKQSFFNSKDLINYNMILADSLIGFCHYYNTFTLYKINCTDIIPIVQISRDSSYFNTITHWNQDNYDWGENKPISQNDKKWLILTTQYWNIFPVGEWYRLNYDE